MPRGALTAYEAIFSDLVGRDFVWQVFGGGIECWVHDLHRVIAKSGNLSIYNIHTYIYACVFVILYIFISIYILYVVYRAVTAPLKTNLENGNVLRFMEKG